MHLVISKDIEGKSYWGTIPENIKYFKEAVQATEKLGIKCAIYTNAWQWSQIMGTNSDFKHLPLVKFKRLCLTFCNSGMHTTMINQIMMISNHLADGQSHL